MWGYLDSSIGEALFQLCHTSANLLFGFGEEDCGGLVRLLAVIFNKLLKLLRVLCTLAEEALVEREASEHGYVGNINDAVGQTLRHTNDEDGLRLFAGSRRSAR